MDVEMPAPVITSIRLEFWICNHTSGQGPVPAGHLPFEEGEFAGTHQGGQLGTLPLCFLLRVEELLLTNFSDIFTIAELFCVAQRHAVRVLRARHTRVYIKCPGWPNTVDARRVTACLHVAY